MRNGETGDQGEHTGMRKARAGFGNPQPAIRISAWAAVVLGTLGTVVALATGGTAAWAMLLVNFLYWTGLAQGMLVWNAAFRTGQATWPEGVNRLGRAAVGFLPTSLGIFLLLFLGREHWLTWIHHPVPEKAVWLNQPFFFVRDAAVLVAMTLLSFRFVKLYELGEGATPETLPAAHARLNRTAAAIVILYAFGYSLLAFDLVMSLAPHWFSSLFGAYFFVGNLYLAMAGLIVTAWLLRGPLGLAHLGTRQLRDMGNLLLSFGLLTTGFFFAQYLTIWYGNLPEETSYLIVRAYKEPWANVGKLLLVICYLGPFVSLIPPRTKLNMNLLGPVSLLVMAGVWAERWMLVMPSLAPDRLAGIGLLTWAMPAACLGALVLVITRSLLRNPEVSPLDEALELAELDLEAPVAPRTGASDAPEEAP